MSGVNITPTARKNPFWEKNQRKGNVKIEKKNPMREKESFWEKARRERKIKIEMKPQNNDSNLVS